MTAWILIKIYEGVKSFRLRFRKNNYMCVNTIGENIPKFSEMLFSDGCKSQFFYVFQ